MNGSARVLALIIPLLSLSAIFAQVDPSSPLLSPEERRRVIQQQENLWNLQPSRAPQSFRSNNVPYAPAPIFTGFQNLLSAETVEVVGAEGGSLYANGIYITVPAQAFPDTSRVRIRLVVLREPRDFILAGVPLNLKQGNRHILLESVGMFHIDFRDAITDRSIEPQTEIAAYAAITDTNADADVHSARVYYRSDDSNDWIEKSTLTNEVDGADGSPVVSMELDGGFGLYTGVDQSGWWNFDIPKPEITCLCGTVARGDVHVFAAGLSYNGLDQVVPDAQGHFRINALKNETVKVYAVQARQEQTSGENRLVPLQIGHLQPLTTHDVTAHTSDPAARCMAVGHLDMHGIDAGIAGNRERLLELLGLPDNTN